MAATKSNVARSGDTPAKRPESFPETLARCQHKVAALYFVRARAALRHARLARTAGRPDAERVHVDAARFWRHCAHAWLARTQA
jgi:hypothetical protein